MRRISRSTRPSLLAITALLFVLSVVLTGCFASNTTWPVGHDLTPTQMTPGLWRSLGSDPLSSAQCSWQKKDGNGLVTGESPHFDFPNYASGHRGPVWVFITPNDKQFISSGCQPFYRFYPVVNSDWSVPLVQPGEPFGEGDYASGLEVKTDTLYVAAVPEDSQGCWSANIGSWFDPVHHMTHLHVPTAGGAVFAMLSSTDAGFWSIGCGKWVVWPY